MTQEKPRVGLMVTCLVDLFRPGVGFATAKLLEDAGCRVCVPETQTCCGQPGFNTGASGYARRLAKKTIAAFEPFDYVTAPSGSCIGMLHHYEELFPAGGTWHGRARALAAKSFEITQFLTDVMDRPPAPVKNAGTVTLHDCCSGLRELGIKEQPRQLLAGVDGLVLHEMEESEVCCGFGGTFCVKYPAIANRMAETKARHAMASGADTLVAGDLGCLLHMAGTLTRLGADLRVRHLVEVLAGSDDGAAIGQPRDGVVEGRGA